MNKLKVDILPHSMNGTWFWEINFSYDDKTLCSKKMFTTPDRALNSLKRFLQKWFPNYTIEGRIHKEKIEKIKFNT